MSNESVSIEILPLNIRVDSLRLQNYYRFALHNDKSGDTFMYGYNKPIHAIDIFNITDTVFHRSIKLENQGPSGIGNVEDIYVVSEDSIFLYTRGIISLVDEAGRVYNKFNLSNFGNYENRGELGYTVHFRMEYNSRKSQMYLYSIYNKIEERIKNPLITEVNLVTNEVRGVPIYYSDYFRSNPGHTGYLSYLNKSYSTKDFLIYNFEYESNIYVYEKETGNVEMFGGESQYSRNLANVIRKRDGEAWNRHAIENTHFFSVWKDPIRPLYYRLHWGDIDYKQSDTQYNSFIDKPLYLMVFSEEFEVLKETRLPQNQFGIFDWAVTNDGLLLSNSHPMADVQEDFLSLSLIKVMFE